MRSRPGKGRFRSLASMLLAFGVALCAGATKAEAGCSHYVVAGKNPTAAVAPLEALDAQPLLELAARPPVRPRPCSGALCSGKPAVPVPAPLVQGNTRAEQWGELTAPKADVSGEGQLVSHPVDLVRPRREGPSIDRPPRLSLLPVS